MIDHVIFDCDGTLLDTESVAAEVCLAAMEELGITGWTLDRYVATFVGRPSSFGWAVVAREWGKPFPEGFNAEVDRRIFAAIAAHPKVIEGVPLAMEAAGRGRSVASSTELQALRRNLDAAGLLAPFNPHVFSASQVRRGKPAPDVFLFAASQVGHDPVACLVIEDSVPGVLAARRAGMRVVGFTGAAHDPEAVGARLSEAGAEIVLRHMDEVASAIAAMKA